MDTYTSTVQILNWNKLISPTQIDWFGVTRLSTKEKGIW